jgi:hypothetical protein
MLGPLSTTRGSPHNFKDGVDLATSQVGTLSFGGITVIPFSRRCHRYVPAVLSLINPCLASQSRSPRPRPLATVFGPQTVREVVDMLFNCVGVLFAKYGDQVFSIRSLGIGYEAMFFKKVFPDIDR